MTHVDLVPQNRSTVGYLALVVLLAAGITIGLALFVIQARAPLADAEFSVAAGEGVGCPVGAGVPTCFRFDVANVGAGEGRLECIVVPQDGTSAVFTASGTDRYLSTSVVPVGDTYPMYTEVEPLEGKDTVQKPTVVCGAAG